MLRALLAVLMLFGTPLPLLAEDVPRVAPRPLASAFHAMQAGRWERARSLAMRDGPAAAALIDWYYLSGGLGTPDQILGFLRDHSDWPGLDYLRKRSEDSMSEATTADILAYYANHPPQTGLGVLSHARALIADGQQGEAEASLVIAWRSMDLNNEEHAQFLAAHGDLLKPHHTARLNMALWRGLKDVEVILPLVPEKDRARATLRKTLASRARVPDKVIADLTEAQRTNPGIAHALFNRHIRANDQQAAITLILKQSKIEDGLGQPSKWSGWRRALARDLMRDGKGKQAYDLASVHQLSEGSDFADLEWLSGYLALTYLDEPDLALDHFQRFRVAVGSPISLGRAGYWIGRTQEALGDPEAAQIAYAEGARHQTSFYGLLAAERAGLSLDPGLSGVADFLPWQDAPIADNLAVQAAVLALAADRLSLAERFVVHLGASMNRTELRQFAQILKELQEPHLQVMLGKAGARRGIILPGPYYALHPLAQKPLPVPAELALAIARRESEFDPIVVSGAGAQGLMQVMPGTARDVARDLGLDHDPARVLSDWEYNTTLGSAYLAQMAEQFDGNIIMVAAAYNAGPARPQQWIERFGDPRLPGAMDITDWIEHIPFRETRNYVMRVSESLPIYRARLGRDPLPQPFGQELTGRSIKPRPPAPAD